MIFNDERRVCSIETMYRPTLDCHSSRYAWHVYPEIFPRATKQLHTTSRTRLYRRCSDYVPRSTLLAMFDDACMSCFKILVLQYFLLYDAASCRAAFYYRPVAENHLLHLHLANCWTLLGHWFGQRCTVDDYRFLFSLHLACRCSIYVTTEAHRTPIASPYLLNLCQMFTQTASCVWSQWICTWV